MNNIPLEKYTESIVELYSRILEAKMIGSFERVDERLSGMDKALQIANEKAVEQYHLLNNTRRDMVSTEVYSVEHKNLEDKISALKKQVDVNTNRIYLGIGAIIVLEFVLKYFMR